MQAITGFFEDGQMLLVDKPLTWTSFNVVGKIRHLIGNRKLKVGHAGTLDPLATGLLIVCTGKMTKKINEYQAQIKEYTGSFTLGSTTPTYDLESEPTDFKPYEHLTLVDLQAATEQFKGAILQVPPIHSAIKQGGKPVYINARKGKEVVLEPRPITITAFDITAVDLPSVDFRVVCSTGTYIRSLANDFGAALQTGAHLSALRRTAIGDYQVQDAFNIETLEQFIKEKKPTRTA
jgi:tRNA pseudouridine55 synthase